MAGEKQTDDNQSPLKVLPDFFPVLAPLFFCRTTIQYWIRRFNANGFAGLREEEGRGRPNSLTQDDIDGINIDLRKTPLECGYSQGIWDGKLLSHHLEVKYGKELGVRQCQRLFSKLGFRMRKPRPVIAKADPELQKAYKKTQEKTD